MYTSMRALLLVLQGDGIVPHPTEMLSRFCDNRLIWLPVRTTLVQEGVERREINLRSGEFT